MAEPLGVLGMIEEGCFAWMQAIALAPDDPIPLRGLAQTLHDLRDYAQAYPLWQQADQLKANEVRTLFHIGQCLENLQRPQEPLALAPENAESLTNLGVVLEALDGLDEAIELHRTAIRLAPQSLFARQNLAQALRYAGDLEGAIAVLREALALAPIAQLVGIRLESLQKGHGMEQHSLCSFADRFVDDQEAIDDRLDFSEIAAVMACCDLVISCDTVVPHLAADLGRPTWLLLCAHTEWRWGLAGEETHWHPSIRLFRQSTMGAWQDPVQRLTAELARLESQGPQRVGPPA